MTVLSLSACTSRQSMPPVTNAPPTMTTISAVSAETSTTPMVNVNVPANVSFKYVQPTLHKPVKASETMIDYLISSGKTKTPYNYLYQIGVNHAIYEAENRDVLICDSNTGEVSRVPRQLNSHLFSVYENVIWANDDYFVLKGHCYSMDLYYGDWSGVSGSPVYALCDLKGNILDYIVDPYSSTGSLTLEGYGD